MYKTLIQPFLERSDHEKTQHATREFLHYVESNPITLKLFEYLINHGTRFTNKKLEVTVDGITFDNPVLLAAGWDKIGRAVKSLHRIGFGGIEIGTVLAYPQPGNSGARLDVIGPGVALNHLGFPSPGMEVVATNLDRYRGSGIPIGINIGKNKYIPLDASPSMHAVVVRRLYEYADYFVLGVSSPNTPSLHKLQKKKYLKNIIRDCNAMMKEIGKKKPLFIKIAPDISEKILDDVIQTIFDEKAAGIIAVNTYAKPDLIAKYGQDWEERRGGLSGNDSHYRNVATKLIASIYVKTQGKMPIIGVGGIHNVETALEKIRAGASLIQLFTGLYSEGPSLPGKINRGIVEYMKREKIKNVKDIVGVDAKMQLTKT